MNFRAFSWTKRSGNTELLKTEHYYSHTETAEKLDAKSVQLQVPERFNICFLYVLLRTFSRTSPARSPVRKTTDNVRVRTQQENLQRSISCCVRRMWASNFIRTISGARVWKPHSLWTSHTKRQTSHYCFHITIPCLVYHSRQGDDWDVLWLPPLPTVEDTAALQTLGLRGIFVTKTTGMTGAEGGPLRRHEEDPR